jgi:hypothetical protein
MPVQTIGNPEQLNAQALADVTSSRKLPSIFQELTQASPALSGLPVYVASSQFGSIPFHFPAFLI